MVTTGYSMSQTMGKQEHHHTVLPCMSQLPPVLDISDMPKAAQLHKGREKTGYGVMSNEYIKVCLEITSDTEITENMRPI